MAVFAAKYWAVTAQARPIRPSSAISSTMRTMCPVSLLRMPRSMMLATSSGMISSNEASRSLNSGPSTHSRP